MRRFAALGLSLAVGVGCGNEDVPMGPSPTAPYSDVELGLTPTTLTPERQTMLPGTPALLGVAGNGQPLVGLVDSTLHALTASGLERRRLFAGPGDPVFLGTLRDLGARAAGGAWLAADAGLFSVDTQYVLPIAALSPLLGVQEATTGPLAGLWLMTSDTLYLSLEDELASFEIPELAGPHQALAIRPDGGEALTVAGGEALVLVADGPDLDVFSLGFELSARSVAATADGLWIAADEGLFFRGADGWQSLQVQGAPLVVGPLESDTNRVYAADGTDLYLLDVEAGTPRAQRLAGLGDGLVTPDGNGGFWLARNGQLEGYSLSGAARFADDIVPFIETHCVACHGDGASDYRQYDVFAPRAEAALTRIRSGDMPRCGAGQLRCPESEHLTPDNYAILERWIAEGKLP